MNNNHQLLKEKMDSTTNKKEYVKFRAVYLRKVEKMKAEQVSLAVGVSTGMIYQWTHRYTKWGVDGLINKPTGGRIWAYMSLDDEKALLEELKPEAMKGLVVVTKIVKKRAEEKLGHAVSPDYAEDLLNRHGWHKITPRTRHPQSSKDEQEEFKKKFQN